MTAEIFAFHRITFGKEGRNRSTPGGGAPAAARIVSRFASPCLAGANGLAEVFYGPNLERPDAHAGMTRDELDGLVEVARLQEQNAADLLLRFRERAVRDRDRAVAKPQRRALRGA